MRYLIEVNDIERLVEAKSKEAAVEMVQAQPGQRVEVYEIGPGFFPFIVSDKGKAVQVRP